MAIAALMVGNFLGGKEEGLQSRVYFCRVVGFVVGSREYWMVVVVVGG